jgi:O-antigen biosynthesis protein WbqV
MVQVSTDKAVNPVGVMGATKRLGELYCQALDLEGAGMENAPRFMTVRFGNVLGSSGSLIPLFQRQLDRRAPLTVTHPEITRFFMTVHEAVQLILHSTAKAMESGLKRGRIIVLDMGEPVKVIDIARRMIRLAGLIPERDVPIDIVGLRPGEKLYEELFDENERRLPSELPGVLEAEPAPIPVEVLQAGFDGLDRAVMQHDKDEVRRLLFSLLYKVTRNNVDIVAPEPQDELPQFSLPHIANSAPASFAAVGRGS